jgi:hypothetical protein
MPDTLRHSPGIQEESHVSWSTSTSPVTKEEAADKIAALEIPYAIQHAVQETNEQVAAAKKAATLLIESGALGEGPFTVNLSGHANAGHTQSLGWSQDSISINVSQVYQKQ